MGDGSIGAEGAALHRLQQGIDAHGGLGALTREVLYLSSDHGETTAGLTGAGGFDGGVERQQVGLLGDGANDLQGVGDLDAGLGQAHHLLTCAFSTLPNTRTSRASAPNGPASLPCSTMDGLATE